MKNQNLMQGVSIEDYETSLSATELLNILEAEVWKIRWTNVFFFYVKIFTD